MAYTDKQIADYTRQLAAKGAPISEIESFVASAKAAQGAAPVAPESKPMPPEMAPEFRPAIPPGMMQRIRESNIARQILGPTANQRMREQARAEAMDSSGSRDSVERNGFLPAMVGVGREIAASTARTAGGVYGAPGGPMGAGLNAAGETVAQVIEGGSLDKGRIAQAGILGAPPLGRGAGFIKDAVRMGLAGATGEAARQTINDGPDPAAREAINEAVRVARDTAARADGTPGSSAPREGIVGDSAAAGLATAGITAAMRGIAKATGVAFRNPTQESLDAIRRTIANTAETDASIAKVVAQGGVTNPASTNPSLVNRTLGAVAGIQNIRNEAVRRNAPVLADMARREAGLAPLETINERTLQTAREVISKPLDDLRAMGMGRQVDLWQKANTGRQDLLEMRTSGSIDPAEFRERLAGQEAAMRSVEQVTDAAARKAGRLDLVGALPNVQERLAKNFDVRRLVPSGTGTPDPDLASAMAAVRKEHPSMMTGELRDIANFNNATAGAAGNPNKVSPHGGTLGPHTAVGMAAVSDGPAGMLAAGLPAARNPARDLLLSPAWQDPAPSMIRRAIGATAARDLTPNYDAPPIVRAILQRLAANVAQSGK